MMNNVVFVVALTIRSLIYLQALGKEGLLPVLCLVLADDADDMYKVNKLHIKDNQYKYVDLGVSIGEFLDKNHVPYVIMRTKDINSESVYMQLKKLTQEYVIYSGYGGCILKKHLFEINKKWIHIHAGRLPDYRGSTTAYYSILQERRISATAIFMNAQIDEGNIICIESFELPSDCIDIDYIFEPYVRSQVLVKALKRYTNENRFEEYIQNNERSETYFIIHPVLKHIAIMSLNNEKQGD